MVRNTSLNLNRKMLPSALMLFSETRLRWWFQDDNMPSHRAKKVKDWIQESPDLNPIESLWQLIGQKVSAMSHARVTQG